MRIMWRNNSTMRTSLVFVLVIGCIIGIYAYVQISKSRGLNVLYTSIISKYLPVRAGKHDVILSAYMNSGSRFTGRLLGYRNDSFYFYEPLWKFSQWDYFKPPNIQCSSLVGDCRKTNFALVNTFKPDEHKPDTYDIVPNMSGLLEPNNLFLHVISNIYNCDLMHLKYVIQARVHDLPSYSGPSWDVYRDCVNKYTARSECLRRLEHVCMSRGHRVMKVLRLTLGSFRPLLKVNPDLKIIHLVRDPRAIINSRLFTRGYAVYGYRGNDSLERNLCDKMSEDFYDGVELMREFPGRVTFLYYEDLIENVHDRMRKLTKFLNMTYNETEIDNLTKVEINLSPHEKGKEYRKDRIENNANWWRKSMLISDIQRVNNACFHVMQLFGYTVHSNEQELRDLNIKTFTIPKQFRL